MWGAVCVLIHPKVFTGVEVRAMCRPPYYYHYNLGRPCLHGSQSLSCWNMFGLFKWLCVYFFARHWCYRGWQFCSTGHTIKHLLSSLKTTQAVQFILKQVNRTGKRHEYSIQGKIQTWSTSCRLPRPNDENWHK